MYLGLFFQPWLSTGPTHNIRSKYRIIQRFFNIDFLSVQSSCEYNKPQHKEEENEEEILPIDSMPVVSELYSMLRDAHEKDVDDISPNVQLPSYFVPELRSYQSKALKWMMNREKITKFTDPEFVPITCSSIPNQPFYFNYRTIELLDCDPGGLKIPTGGILADEMGLGKTVEMLALILSNRNLKRKRIDIDDDEDLAGNIRDRRN